MRNEDFFQLSKWEWNNIALESQLEHSKSLWRDQHSVLDKRGNKFPLKMFSISVMQTLQFTECRCDNYPQEVRAGSCWCGELTRRCCAFSIARAAVYIAPKCSIKFRFLLVLLPLMLSLKKARLNVDKDERLSSVFFFIPHRPHTLFLSFFWKL